MTPGAEPVVQLLTARGETLAVAESLTGGLVAAELTAVPGASRAFRGSVTAYATDAKASVLGVDADLLAAHGAVHGEVALEMAHGVRRLLGADWGIATTGVAGPEPQDGQPVGTVFVAVAGPFADAIPTRTAPDPTERRPFTEENAPNGGNDTLENGVPQYGSGVRGVAKGGDRGGRGHDRSGTNAGKIVRLRLNGDRAEIRMRTVRSVLGLLLRGLTGEHLENAGAQDTERNGGT